MNLEQAAKEIAEEADECCHRGDEWINYISPIVLQKLKEAYNDAIEEAAKIAERSETNITKLIAEDIRSLKK